MDILQLANAFRSARLECRLTQQDVARGAGVSVVTVSRFERGELLEIGVIKLLKLFNQLGLELYPRHLGHVRTLDDIQRERSASSATYLGKNAPAIQRVRHSRAEKTRG